MSVPAVPGERVPDDALAPAHGGRPDEPVEPAPSGGSGRPDGPTGAGAPDEGTATAAPQVSEIGPGVGYPDGEETGSGGDDAPDDGSGPEPSLPEPVRQRIMTLA
ncbi:MAG TPA: hypothetical protein VF755_10625, partial [Catenuloplanes sp.]